ncbi:excalibur calcium-binding domain-containing protein [Streptomyces sp. NPDC091268]|uniref:excalibur calcium-binding domain-containing protein n=1 Tax=Streptomyces sp. NPDC091268 TaxID=3365979 RepID=UPI003813635D
MFQPSGYRARRGFAVVAIAGALALTAVGCEDPAASKTADKPGGPVASPSAPAAASAPSAPPTMPSLIGRKSAEAEALVKPLVSKPVEARSAFSDVPLAADHAQWAVCFQTPAAASPVPPDTSVEMSLAAPGTPCPERAGAALHPAKAPAPAKTPVPAATPGKPKPPAASPTAAPGPKDVVYKNCAEARAAGAAPIRRGQPGYSRTLDRDNDGIACDT